MFFKLTIIVGDLQNTGGKECEYGPAVRDLWENGIEFLIPGHLRSD